MSVFTQIARFKSFGKCTLWKACQPERCFQTSHKSMKQVLTKAMRIKHEDHFKRIDSIPDEYEMIYKLPLHYSLNFAKFLTVTTTIALPCTYVYNECSNIPISDANFVSNIAIETSDLIGLIGGLMLTNYILYRCCDSVILRIYRHEENYVAMIPSQIPRKNLKLHFKQGEVTESPPSFLTKYIEGVLFKINGKTTFIISDRFRKPSDFYEILHTSDSDKYTKY